MFSRIGLISNKAWNVQEMVEDGGSLVFETMFLLLS